MRVCRGSLIICINSRATSARVRPAASSPRTAGRIQCRPKACWPARHYMYSSGTTGVIQIHPPLRHKLLYCLARGFNLLFFLPLRTGHSIGFTSVARAAEHLHMFLQLISCVSNFLRRLNFLTPSFLSGCRIRDQLQSRAEFSTGRVFHQESKTLATRNVDHTQRGDEANKCTGQQLPQYFIFQRSVEKKSISQDEYRVESACPCVFACVFACVRVGVRVRACVCLCVCVCVVP